MFILDNTNCYGLGGVLNIIKFILTLIQWSVPIILILLGTIDLVKAVIAQKEEEIKKNQKTLLKRAIAALIVFLVPLIVSVLMGWIGTDEWKACWKKADTDLSGLFDINYGEEKETK